VFWGCRKQQPVATSTCAAKYMALAMTTKHHLWLKRGVEELLTKDIPMALICDQDAAIDVAYNPKLNDQSRHIDVSCGISLCSKANRTRKCVHYAHTLGTKFGKYRYKGNDEIY